MTDWLHDVRLAVRLLGRRPLFSGLAVLTLAVGLGVNAVAFTLVNGFFLRGFSTYVEPGVLRVLTTPATDEGGLASLAELARFEEGTRGSAVLAAEGRLSLAWRHHGIAEQAWAMAVSSAYFSLVRPPLVAGRAEVGLAEGTRPTVVVGERFWREKLGSPPLTGLGLRLNELDVDVAGVIAEQFNGPGGMYSPDVWVPLREIRRFGTAASLERSDTRWLFVIARPDAAITSATVRGQLEAVASLMASESPDVYRGRSVRLVPLGQAGGEGGRGAATIVMGVIGLILVLACFNVANLLLARAVERERDMGIRTALGASPARLMRLVLAEGIVLALVAGLAALAVAAWTRALVTRFAVPIDQPQTIDLAPDTTVLAFLAGLVVLAGVLPGLWPALAAARVRVTQAIGAHGADLGGRPSRLRRRLVAAQVAGATVFLVLAALFVQSFRYASAADLGFAQDELLVAEVEPAAHGYEVERAGAYMDRLVARASSLPGVAGVAVADRAPFFIGYDRTTAVWPATGACAPEPCSTVPTFSVSAGYFATMGIALAQGREFTHARDAVPAEVIVNGPFARQQWPDAPAVGQTLRLGPMGQPVLVVGVTGPTRTRALDRETPTLFLPLGPPALGGALAVIVRTPSPGLLVRPFVEGAHAVDPRVALGGVRTMRERMAVPLWPFETLGWVFAICAALALVLATTGLAGVVVHAVARRGREFGVRMTLGAGSRDIVVEVVQGGLRLLGPGLAVGVLLAAAGARLVQAALVGVNVLDPRIYLAVALVQTAVVVVACLGPALRSSRVDPARVLRRE